jgi:hypothetical protein|tara:strand:+ start:54756 stop:55463 length:708 start_codon:yes stop_codon:yes gene_type:complete
MSKSLIDGIYDIYLQKTGKGQEYEVPICMDDNGTIKEIQIRVWAKNPKEAEERALSKAYSISFKEHQSIEQKSLGLVLPRDHYKPKGIAKTMTSPIAVWRDPVYKKALSNVFGAAGYRVGTMTKLSISELKKQVTSVNENIEINSDYLLNALRVNIISLFIWVGVAFMGVIFLFLGFHPGNEGKFIISWLNPYIVASIVCLFIGFLASYKTIKDYWWITQKLEEIEQQEIVEKDE